MIVLALLLAGKADPTGPWLALAGLITALGGAFGGVAAVIAAVGAWRRHNQPPPVDRPPDGDEKWFELIEQLEAANEHNVDLSRQLADANRRAAAANARSDRAQKELIDYLSGKARP